MLRLIATGLSNRDIAQELVLATGTVKKHINNNFTKFDVRSCTQAGPQAGEFYFLWFHSRFSDYRLRSIPKINPRNPPGYAF